MKKAVGAVLWHCTAFDDDDFQHRFCPVSENTWCKWQHSKITGTETCRNKINLPKWLHSILKPIFVDLSSDELLMKCLHGRTQNANEALNNVIWQKCPKNIFVQRDMIEMGVNSAVIEFNEGASGIYDILGHFGIPPGCITMKLSDKHSQKQAKNTERKMSSEGKRRRTKLRSIRKGYLDKEEASEGGKSYEPGSY